MTGRLQQTSRKLQHFKCSAEQLGSSPPWLVWLPQKPVPVAARKVRARSTKGIRDGLHNTQTTVTASQASVMQVREGNPSSSSGDAALLWNNCSNVRFHWSHTPGLRGT